MRTKGLGSLIGLLVCFFACSTVPRSSSTAARAANTIEVDVAQLAPLLIDQPSADVSDQLRDWALYGVLVELGLGPDAISQGTLTLSPVRLPYLDELFTFEHGSGRHAVLPDGRAVAVLDRDDPHPIATLGRLADKVRRKTGEKPREILPFVFAPDLPSGHILIEPRPPVGEAALFGSAYGFVEAVVKDEPSFKSWLASIDDVVSAEIVDGGVRLAGRRFPDHRTPGATSEDVAVLYRAHTRLMIERAIAPPDSNVPESPGFSLDPPDENVAALVSRVDLSSDACGVYQRALARAEEVRVAARPRDALLAGEAVAIQIERVARKFGGRGACTAWLPDLVRRRTAGDELPNEDDALVFWLEKFAANDTGRQCARYDGELRGTRVGMNLFYTDLLAKLWGFDTHHSAPALSVPGFLTEPRIGIPAAYRQERLRLTGTRIWFGTRTEAVARVPHDRGLLFEPIVSRVFAAGHTSGHAHEEARPAETERRVIEWWDKHYASVADFEPEYHVQNQVMKWSLVTALLQKQGQAAFLADEGANLNYALTFDRWLQQNRSRLRYPHPVPILDRQRWVDGCECLPLLASYEFDGGSGILLGGVTAGGNRDISRVPHLDLQMPPALRLSPPISPPGSKVVVERAFPKYTSAGRVEVLPVSGTRMRTGVSELALGKTAVVVTGEPGALTRLALESASGEVGRLDIQMEPSGLSLRWLSGALERRRLVTERTLRALESGKEHRSHFEHVMAALTGRPVVSTSTDTIGMGRLGDGRDAVRMTFSNGLLERSSGGDSVRSSGRIFGTEITQINPSELAASEWQRLTVLDSARNLDVSAGWKRAFSPRGPPPEARPIHLRGLGPAGIDVQAFVERDGAVWLHKPEGTDRWWTELDKETHLSSGDLRTIQAHARMGAIEVRAGELSTRMGDAVRAVDNGARPELSSLLPGPPAAPDVQTRFAQRLLDEADYRLAGANAERALPLYHAYQEVLRKADPEVLIREGIARLQSGQLAAGLDEVSRQMPVLQTSKARPSERLRAALDGLAGQRPFANAVEVWRSQLGFPSTVPADVARQLTIENDGLGLQTRLVVNAARERSLSRDERRALAVNARETQVDLIYAEALYPFNRADFELEPHENLAEIAVSTSDRLSEVEALPQAAFRPDVLVVGRRRYRLMHAGGAGPPPNSGSGRDKSGGTGGIGGTGGTREPTGLTRPSYRIIMIRSCDRDRDGRVSEAEARDCDHP
jgi:hypothetical protein